MPTPEESHEATGASGAAGKAGAAAVPAAVRWVRGLSHLTGLLSAVALVLATLITAHGVFTRYVLRAPTTWQTEATIYLLMLVTFVGAAYGLRHNAHVGVDLVVDRLGTRARLVLRIVTAVLSLAVVAVIAWTAYGTWAEAYLFDHRSPTAWRFPLWIAYAILPVGMTCVALQLLAMIAEAVLGLLGRIDPAQITLLGGTGEADQVGTGTTSPATSTPDGTSPDGTSTEGTDR